MIEAALLGAFFFGILGFVGVQLGNAVAERLERLPGSPEPFNPPVPLLLAGCAIIGALTVPHAASIAQIAIVGIVLVALSAVWITDAKRGLVPDLFTLGPLGLLLLAALWQHQPSLLISAAIPFIPFAIAAALSKGRGMGWGDAKLVALGGAVLGAQTATLAFALACAVAVAVAYLRGRRAQPIAFAPYLAASIAITLPLGVGG
jgi:prepilin signal peptidase PulO-like enzyme (type II secretory pathway)